MLKSEWQINFKDSILLKSPRQITDKDLHKSTFYGLSVLWCKLTKNAFMSKFSVLIITIFYNLYIIRYLTACKQRDTLCHFTVFVAYEDTHEF